jgi:protease-4
MRDGPSPEAERMQNWLLDSIYDTFVDLIAKGRGVDAAKAKALIDGAPYTADKAKAAGLIDAVEHRQDFESMLKEKFGKKVVFDKKYGKKKPPKIDFNSPFAMFKILGDILNESQKKKSDKPAIGIVYVEGPIMLGGGREDSPFSAQAAMSTNIRRALDEAAADSAIKAVVLRVNSPGGSAVASEIILDATRRVKAKKPFVVSMGDVAGSGGYYVACGADTVFADDATITGSIGVVSGKLVTTAMWKKIGITFKDYKRGQNAGMLSSSTPFSKEERERMQGFMDEIYGVFKQHVVEIRGSKLKKPIDEIAGGRVYTGKQALELGLVDKIGTLDDAIAFVAGQAKLSDYDVNVVPAPKNFLERIIEQASGDGDEGKGVNLKAHTGRHDSLIDLALPYLKGLDPARVRSIQSALGQLQLLAQDGVILMMPEFQIAR